MFTPRPTGAFSSRAGAIQHSHSALGPGVGRPLVTEAAWAKLRLGGSAGKTPIKVRSAPEGPKFISDNLGDSSLASPRRSEGGKESPLGPTVRPKTNQQPPMRPSQSSAPHPVSVVYCHQAGATWRFPPPTPADSPGWLPVIITQGAPERGCLRYALTACCLGVQMTSAPSLTRPAGSAMVTPLGRPVPLPRRLPTAGDRLSFVRISIEEQAVVEKVFLG